MRLHATQQLSDGELYYIIHNGVRWTGMPAWGEPGNDRGQLEAGFVHPPPAESDSLPNSTTWSASIPGAKQSVKKKSRKKIF